MPDPPLTPDPGGYEPAGTIIAARYKVLRPIGRGGMGVVYVVQHLLLEKKFALKLLSADFARANPELVERFEREAKAVSLLDHENIVNVTDFGTTSGGAAFLVMELLDGPHLAELMRVTGRLPFERARRFGVQICRALQVAHEKGIIHRDVKPENVIIIDDLARGEQVKLLDFGLARSLTTAERRLTRAGVVMGTPEYLSPEQARGDKIDHRADIYAVGCVLYEMLTGMPPFQSATAMGVMKKQIFEEPQPMRQRSPRIRLGQDGEAVVMKALAKEASARFQTMNELALALEACSLPVEEDRLPRAQRPEANPELELARAALEHRDASGAFDAAERAVEAVGGPSHPSLSTHRGLLTDVYEAYLGDRARVLMVANQPAGIDARAAFLLSRIDGASSIDDLLDVSGMPRLEAARLIARFLRQGVVAAG